MEGRSTGCQCSATLSQGNPVLPGDPEVLAALGGRMIGQWTQKACSELRGKAHVAP